ncbi:polyamine aminopropyltransferase [Natronospirillum operosum]|uniref:Polyamine aminopropyltransferase n=1 Tax=Natronospirillum operosum TaxID=2759953 RepID=A0A4Z0WAZ5_9GAMM|nr:polyamine aminopropyltransferase [Natronospirillum operosum]TGG91141.1 polyamine aminopropyltransferase [Natronospirillum operosum]
MTQTISERLYEGYAQTFEASELLFEVRTEHQHLQIFETPALGRVMMLDGIVQTTEKDEFIYHEMMVHVPLFAHPKPRRVLIIGGGDGGILREVLKHPEVEQVTQVEIDQSVIDLCRQYFPNHSQGAFDDPRANIVIADGREFVAQCQDRFDVIISDSTDPMGPGEVLFTSDFYADEKRCLNPGGIMVAQNGVPFLQGDEITTTWRRLTPLYQDASFYVAPVPTYVGGFMTLAWATDDPALRRQSAADIASRVQAVQRQNPEFRPRYYNEDVHVAAFALPNYIRALLN